MEIQDGVERLLAEYFACRDEGAPPQKTTETISWVSRGVADEVGENPPEQTAVVRLHVDRFSYIKECYGQTTADAFLRGLARCLLVSLEGGERCAFLRGNDFVLLLRCTSAQAAKDRIQELLSGLERYQVVDGLSAALTAGVAMSSGTERLEQLLERAAMAAEAARTPGERRRVATYNGPRMKAYHQQLELELSVEAGLWRREFEMYLQPIVDLRTGRVEEAEALARWNRPGVGLVSPEQFMPVMERSGCVVELDFYMMEEACKTLARWEREGRTICPIAVNQSPLHLTRKDYVQQIMQLLRRYGVDPRRMVLELTESVCYQDWAVIERTSAVLRSLGFRLSIDDFGAGYSSLDMLRHTEVDIIKLDKSLLSTPVQAERHRAFLCKTIELIHALHAEALCEGVERAEQAKLLQDCGCRLGQGYLYSKPIPVAEFEARYGAACRPEGRVFPAYGKVAAGD